MLLVKSAEGAYYTFVASWRWKEKNGLLSYAVCTLTSGCVSDWLWAFASIGPVFRLLRTAIKVIVFIVLSKKRRKLRFHCSEGDTAMQLLYSHSLPFAVAMRVINHFFTLRIKGPQLTGRWKKTFNAVCNAICHAWKNSSVSNHLTIQLHLTMSEFMS